MSSTTRKRDRVFALLGAVLFLVTASALTIAVVWNAVANKGNNNSKPSQSQTAANCADNNTEATFPLPPQYQSTGSAQSLQSTDLTEGTGAAAKNGDCLVVKYYGELASNGKEFDENYDKPIGFAFTLGQHQVISGWDQGLVGMKVGGERRLVIPASLAYGNQSPDPATIPENSDLVFYVKLLRIQ